MIRDLTPLVALLATTSYVRVWTLPAVRERKNEHGQASLLTIIAVVLVVAITVLLVLHLAVPKEFTESLTGIITGLITGIGGAEVALRRYERRKGPIHPRRIRASRSTPSEPNAVRGSELSGLHTNNAQDLAGKK